LISNTVGKENKRKEKGIPGRDMIMKHLGHVNGNVNEFMRLISEN
jgi:hypothetical protein